MAMPLNVSSWNDEVLYQFVPDDAWLRFLELWSMLRAIGLLWAVGWLGHRIWQVNKIPRDQLEDKLGLDIPPIPFMSLGGVSSNSVKLYWLNSNSMSASSVYAIDVNGIKVGECRPGDTTIEILGLLPGHCYSIRTSATNSSGCTTSAPIIRVQTGRDTSPINESEPCPSAFLRTAPAHLDASEHQTSSKDALGTQPHISRGAPMWKTPALNTHKVELADRMVAQNESSDEDDSTEKVEELMERLEQLKGQKDELDKQIEEDDADFKDQVIDLSKERDGLRQSYKEREEASSELRRQGNQLDKANRFAQSRKAAKERELQAKRTERQKFRADTERRDREIHGMEAEIEEINKETSRCIFEKDEFMDDKRKTILEDQNAIKVLEEELHAKGVQLKALEQKREEMGVLIEDHRQSESHREQDDTWEMRYQTMQAQLLQWRHALHQASIEEQQVKDHLSWWLDKRNRNPEYFTTAADLEHPSLAHSRSSGSRHANSRTSTISSPNYQTPSGATGSDLVIPPTFPPSGPFFNMGNGTAMAPGSGQINLSPSEADLLTGGAAMSPAANELLPSNLFRDEDPSSQSPLIRDPPISIGGEAFARHALSHSDTSIRGPNTPISTGSRTGSLLPSPRDSFSKLHGIRPRSETFDDFDRHSINSSSASLRPSITVEGSTLASNRFTNLFSSPFNRQRGKSSAQEPPPLGTLKQGQSQSFPRKYDQDEIDASGNRRRRGSHTSWVNPMANLLARNNAQADDERVITARTGTGRRSRLNMFGSKFDNSVTSDFVDGPSSSRPSSTYSHDLNLTRPSSESPASWWPAPEGLPNRNSPLSMNWVPPSGPWSSMQSRRASIQHGSTTNLSIGSIPIEPDEYPGVLKKQKSDQAPIGTRPQSSQHSATPKLNPAAPTFKTLFSRGDGKKVAKQEKGGVKSGDKFKERDSLEKTDTDENEAMTDSSPGNPRLSRDAQSINTATSTNESHESFDRSTSGTPSEALTPSGVREPKESLMQKITRKSSSSKFNVPWSKERGLFSKRVGEPSTPGEADEDNSTEGQSGKGTESASSTPQHERPGRTSLSWPNIRKKAKKVDAADMSSEAGEEED